MIRVHIIDAERGSVLRLQRQHGTDARTAALVARIARTGCVRRRRQPEGLKVAERESLLQERDTDRLVTVLDKRYYYNTEGYLRSSSRTSGRNSDVRTLFHLLNQAKENLALIIEKNESVYEVLLELLQSSATGKR